jgi:hypothetical protein
MVKGCVNLYLLALPVAAARQGLTFNGRGRDVVAFVFYE